MFPIRDHNPSERTPFVTYTLIALNIAVFVLMSTVFTGEKATFKIYDDFALIPYELMNGQGILTLLTSMFLHGGFMHIAGNMLYLWIFGDNLEDAFGHVGFLLFYLASGVAAGLAQVASGPDSFVPMVGASGAIAGVMGGYILLYPKARVDIFIFLIVFVRIIPLPAWIMLGLWMGMQIIGGIGANADTGGVAYWAHVGGFVMGLILTVPLFFKRGGTAFWNRTHGQPPHPAAQYEITRTRIPRVARRR